MNKKELYIQLENILKTHQIKVPKDSVSLDTLFKAYGNLYREYRNKMEQFEKVIRLDLPNLSRIDLIRNMNDISIYLPSINETYSYNSPVGTVMLHKPVIKYGKYAETFSFYQNEYDYVNKENFMDKQRLIFKELYKYSVNNPILNEYCIPVDETFLFDSIFIDRQKGAITVNGGVDNIWVNGKYFTIVYLPDKNDITIISNIGATKEFNEKFNISSKDTFELCRRLFISNQNIPKFLKNEIEKNKNNEYLGKIQDMQKERNIEKTCGYLEKSIIKTLKKY